MTLAAASPAGPLDPRAAGRFDTAMANARSGHASLLVFVGAPGEAREVLAGIASEAAIGRSGRVLEVEPLEGERYDPIAAAARAWRRGARRVIIAESDRRIALEWMGVMPVWGDLFTALVETFRALLRRRGTTPRDREFSSLLRVARRHPLVLVVHDLHTADSRAVHRLGAAVLSLPARARILLVGGADAPAQGQARPPILDIAAGLPSQRCTIEPLAHRGAAIGTLGGVSSDALDALRAGAVIGDAFDGLAVAYLLDVDELNAEDRLAIAVRTGLIGSAGTIDLPDGDVASAYHFDSSAIRDAALAGMAADARAHLESRFERLLADRANS